MLSSSLVFRATHNKKACFVVMHAMAIPISYIKKILAFATSRWTADEMDLLRSALRNGVLPNGQAHLALESARIAGEELNLDFAGFLAAMLQFLSAGPLPLAPLGDDAEAMAVKLRQLRTLHTGRALKSPDVFIQFLLKVSGDIRLILVLLATRLAELRAMKQQGNLSEGRAIAEETSKLYAPLAHRLGLYKIKDELEVLSMQFSMPEIYLALIKKVEEAENKQQQYFDEFLTPVKPALDASGLDYTIKYRTKSVPSIYAKMRAQNIPFEEVYDLFAMRIILQSEVETEKADCWKAYSAVTGIYPPHTSRLRDWISVARPNGYESLHITVDGPARKPVEVQIRTCRMHENAENGMAAHWRYKNRNAGGTSDDVWLLKAREMIEADLGQYGREQKLDAYESHIFVFTPQGDLKKLRAGASVLDFAFEVHTDVGKRCTGAKVNGAFVSLKQKLATGDTIEVITSRNQKPAKDWLNWVVTPRAISKIKRLLKDAEYSQADLGKDAVLRKLSQIKVEYNDEVGSKLVNFYKAESALDLFHGVYEGRYDLLKIKEALVRAKTDETPPAQPKVSLKQTGKLKAGETPILINGEPFAGVKIARCCQPVFGDEIFGFVTVVEGIKIHRTNCHNANRMMGQYPYRIVEATWASEYAGQAFVASLRLSGSDRTGLLNDITLALSEEPSINIRTINLNGENGKIDGILQLSVQNKSQLDRVVARISRVKGIRNVQRSA